jgi:hypothetical protein
VDSSIASPSAEPHRSSARAHIIDDVFEHIESEPTQQSRVFIRRQARVVQGITPIAPDRLSMRWPCVEHQQRVVSRMLRKDREHLPLVIVVEVKETVPTEDAIEVSSERQAANVGLDPFVIG